METKISDVLKNGNWMLRRSNGGKSCSRAAKGFKWNPIGVWTEAPDWDPRPRCGGGLHGCGPESEGHYNNGEDIDFCACEDVVDIDSEKLKCRRAVVLLRNELPEGLKIRGYLDLSGTRIAELSKNLYIGRYLDIRNTLITAIPKNLTVCWSLFLRGTQITKIPKDLKVGGFIHMQGLPIRKKDIPEHLKNKCCF